MKHKKWISTFLALSVSISSCSIFNTIFTEKNTFSVYAEDTEKTYQNLFYTVSDNKIEITGCTDDTQELVIPESIDGINVTSVKRYAFADNQNIKSVSLPGTLTYIDDAAFQNCTALTSFEMPDSLTQIGNKLLMGCTGITSVKISKSLNNIMEYTFADTAIESVEIPEGVIHIGSGCFLNTPLKNVNLPSSAATIGIDAFKNCSQLESINLEGISQIEGGAFTDCEKLEKITLCPKMTKLDCNFSGCSSLEEIIIPEGVKQINGIINCESLEYVYLPSTLTAVYNGFSNCPKLKTVEFADQRTYWTFQVSFSGCTSLEEFIFPTGVDEVRDYMFTGCSNLEYVELTGQITAIGRNAFADCPELDYIFIPDSVTSIDSTAFGYVKDETGNYVKSDKDIIIITESENSAAADFAKENGFTSVSADSIHLGDLDFNQVLDARDITAMKQYLMGVKKAGAVHEAAGDINGDGSFDVFDLSAFKYIALLATDLD